MPRAILIAAGITTAATTGLAIAQSGAPVTDAIEQTNQEAAEAQNRSVALEAEAARAIDEAAKARAAEAAVGMRIIAGEKEIDAAEANVHRVATLRAGQRARLAAQQGPIVRLTAALQTMARRPPALALVQPGSLADVVHVRAVLDAQLPAVQARTAGLRAEITRGLALQHQADRAAARLHDGSERLRSSRIELAKLEANHRMRAQALTDDALHESDRAMALGEDARDIADLVDKLDAQADRRARLAALPGPMLRPPVPGRVDVPAPETLPPASLQLAYRLPVNGQLMSGLGEVSEAGVRARGLTIDARHDSLVIAPARGRIAYAGRFRGYDNIVIIDHGGGWTSLVTGLSTLRVNVGEAVDQGSPLGRTHGGKDGVTVELRRGGQPVDIAPLLGPAQG